MKLCFCAELRVDEGKERRTIKAKGDPQNENAMNWHDMIDQMGGQGQGEKAATYPQCQLQFVGSSDRLSEETLEFSGDLFSSEIPSSPEPLP